MTTSKLARHLAAVTAAMLFATGLSGCAMDSDAVDQSSEGAQRFVSGDGTVTQYGKGDRPKAPRVSGELVDGETFSLTKLRGNVVVLNFWGSWCAPCRAEADHLVEVANRTHERGVRFIGVNVRDSKDRAEAFDRSYQVPYPSIFDPAGRVALAFRQTPPNTIPATIVIDRKGGIAAVFRKPVTLSELEPVVTKVASQQ